MPYISKGDSGPVRCDDRQLERRLEQGWELCEGPPVEADDLGAPVRLHEPRLAGTRKLEKDGRVRIVDERQLPKLLAAGWTSWKGEEPKPAPEPTPEPEPLPEDPALDEFESLEADEEE